MSGRPYRTLRLVTLALLASSAVPLGAACVASKQGISAEDKSRLAPYVLDAVPEGATKIDVSFEKRVHLVGYTVSPEVAPAGTPVTITYYWRCDDPLEEGWQLFTHVQHEGYDKPENLDNVGPLREPRGTRQVLGPDRWERGKIYADEQTFTMPVDMRGPETVVYVGIYKGDARLRIVSGPRDGDNRAIVARVKTGAPVRKVPAAKAPGDIPSLFPVKLPPGTVIEIDGKSAEPAWASASSTGPFVDVGTGQSAESYPVTGSARVTWDDDNLYVFIDVRDRDVVGYFTTKEEQPNDWTAGGQPMTWTRDTAEIMIDPDGDGDNVDYYELQINPANKVFASRFDAYNAPKVEPRGPFGHEDWAPKMKSAVVVRGTIDHPGDADEGYSVEAAIPWSSFAKGAKTLPPKPGDTWRVNFYAMEKNGGTAWSPILRQGNFHKSSRFGRVIWSTKESLADAAAESDAGSDGGVAGDADASAPAHDGGALDGGLRFGALPLFRRRDGGAGAPPP